jgi:hypothetical protein
MELQANTIPLESRVPVAEVLTLRSSASRVIDAQRVKNEFGQREAVEVLIPDSRAELSPAQSVEHKLTNMLRGGAIPMSHIRLAKLRGRH